MGSTRWEAAQELLKLHDRMNRLFGAHDLDEEHLSSGSWTPACDILETREAVIVRAEVPGVKREDIEISLDNGVLTLRGSRKLEQETEERTFYRIERSYGSFVRSFTLARSVDPDRISANLEDGVLEIRMFRREETKPRQIKIHTGDEPSKT